jgi:ADP-ribose pyrophosphatase YjhB (NUDIX family)
MLPKKAIKPDRFNGLTINVTEKLFSDYSPQQFKTALHAHVLEWKKQQKKGVWLKIPSLLAKFVPSAIETGFSYHHCMPNFVMLTLWLPEGTSSLPLRPHHQLGVGGYILNAKNEILVIQEKHGITAGMKDFWKLPGGVVDPNESIAHAVEREVLEETGVRVKFQTIASVRESHQGMYGGMTDLYCVCVCVLDESVYKGEQSPVPVPQEKEIAASKWMLADEFFKLKFYSRRSLFSDLLRHAALTAQDIKGGVGSVGRQSGGAAHTKGLVYTEGAKSRTGKVRDGIYASSKL